MCIMRRGSGHLDQETLDDRLNSEVGREEREVEANDGCFRLSFNRDGENPQKKARKERGEVGGVTQRWDWSAVNGGQ